MHPSACWVAHASTYPALPVSDLQRGSGVAAMHAALRPSGSARRLPHRAQGDVRLPLSPNIAGNRQTYRAGDPHRGQGEQRSGGPVLSPIKDPSIYPEDWLEIRARILEHARYRCECEGECGRGSHDGRCPNRNGGSAYGTGSKVVLTTAHLDHDAAGGDHSESNLKAMYQKCHNLYDAPFRAKNAAQTRREKRNIGQETLCL